ncbi:MAG: cytochrome c4 [Rhodospirillales bacterium]|nr:cytochrome c4 [Rhodospirillales bacterium]
MGLARPLVVVVSMIVLAPSESTAEGDVGAGREKAARERCTECHGADGLATAPDQPNLAGQKPRYLAKQLHDFRLSARGQRSNARLGERRHPTMNANARDLSDQDLVDVAAWLASLPCGTGRQVAEAPRPQKASRCHICHGPQGFSEYAMVPNIGGQNRTYLERQLIVFRDSSRGQTEWLGNRREHPMMTPQSIPLTDQEVAELADYFASLGCEG